MGAKYHTPCCWSLQACCWQPRTRQGALDQRLRGVDTEGGSARSMSIAAVMLGQEAPALLRAGE